MKHSHLRQIVEYIKRFRKISAIYRVDDRVLKIVFDKDDVLYFDMSASHAKIFKCADFVRSKIYSAPFDVLLFKRFNRADIKSVALHNDDKIIRFELSVASAYKSETTYLQLEFTGKHTNIIILDENEIVLEALRHVDLYASFREVRVGQKLLEAPKAPYTPKEYPINNMERYLYGIYEEEQLHKLEALKEQKVRALQKRLTRLEESYDALESEEVLEFMVERAKHYGNLVLLNMASIQPYKRILTLEDYDGSVVKIELEKSHPSVAAMADSLFAKSKKAKQKLKNLHIERTSLKEKMEHIRHFIYTVEEAKDIAKIQLLFPKQQKGKKQKQSDSIEIFWIEGYKVMLGKSEKGNIELLQNAKARDIWLHMKDMPSAHVIIATDKQNVPMEVIESAARLCVDFTMFQQGRFLVDYTPRREVKIQEGANVLYYNYKTIEVDTRS